MISFSHKYYWAMKNVICVIQCRWWDLTRDIRRFFGILPTVNILPDILIESDFSDVIYVLTQRINWEKERLTINNRQTFRKHRIELFTKLKEALLAIK